jgi:hypothetical protein
MTDISTEERLPGNLGFVEALRPKWIGHLNDRFSSYVALKRPDRHPRE